MKIPRLKLGRIYTRKELRLIMCSLYGPQKAQKAFAYMKNNGAISFHSKCFLSSENGDKFLVNKMFNEKGEIDERTTNKANRP